jgi:methylmalonyl-CoA/ethylmalonyl-CoA epimerase
MSDNEMKIDHLGIAVESLEESLRFYRDSLGLECEEFETVEDQKVRVAMLPIGESRVELLEAISDDSPIAKFLKKRGPGIHHICVEVSDIRDKLNRLKSQGVRLIDEQPRPGAGGHLVAFVHPSSTHGVLIELTQRITKETDNG